MCYLREEAEQDICEKSRAQNLIDAAILLKDEVYTRISDLKTVQDIFSADLRHHNIQPYSVAKRVLVALLETRKLSYVSEWELVYHEIFAISNSFSDIIQPDAIEDIGAVLHHELFIPNQYFH